MKKKIINQARKRRYVMSAYEMEGRLKYRESLKFLVMSPEVDVCGILCP